MITWLKKNTFAAIAAALWILGATGAAFWFRNRALSAEARAKAAEAKNERQKLLGARKEAERNALKHDERIKVIDEKIADTEAQIAEARKEASDKSLDELLADFRRRNY